MILITGGAYQGKTEFAHKLAEKMSFDIRNESWVDHRVQRSVVSNLHLMVREFLQEGKDPYTEIERLVKEQPQVIVTVNELGCGIVPVDPFDRQWRETTGRICCMLAKKAEAVYRVTCGVPVQIK